jgi:hypothetical protein
MHDRRFFSRLKPAFRWLLMVACTLPLVVTAEVDFSGIYQGHAPASDAARRTFMLRLDPDGSAVFTTRYIGKGESVQHGRWTKTGSQVMLALDPMGPNRPPGPITFRHHDHELSPLHWDPSEWGRSGPPVLHLSQELQGGF